VWFKNKTLDIALKSPFLKNILELGLVVHICNPRTQAAKEGALRVGGQPGVHGETLYQRKKERKT
jgi:hypothetical protein